MYVDSRDELGFNPAAILSVIQSGVNLVKSVTGGGSGSLKVSGGGATPLSFSGKCPNEPDPNEWAAAWAGASAMQRSRVQSLWKFGAFDPLSPGFITQAFAGGSNCSVDSGYDQQLYDAVQDILTTPAYQRNPSLLEEVGQFTKDEILRRVASQPAVQRAAGQVAYENVQQAAFVSGPVLFGIGALALILATRKGRR